MKRKTIISTAILALLFSSCQKDNLEHLSPQKNSEETLNLNLLEKESSQYFTSIFELEKSNTLRNLTLSSNIDSLPQIPDNVITNFNNSNSYSNIFKSQFAQIAEFLSGNNQIPTTLSISRLPIPQIEKELLIIERALVLATEKAVRDNVFGISKTELTTKNNYKLRSLHGPHNILSKNDCEEIYEDETKKALYDAFTSGISKVSEKGVLGAISGTLSGAAIGIFTGPGVVTSAGIGLVKGTIGGIVTGSYIHIPESIKQYRDNIKRAEKNKSDCLKKLSNTSCEIVKKIHDIDGIDYNKFNSFEEDTLDSLLKINN